MNDFPMPKTIPARDNGIPDPPLTTSPRDYAPKRGLEAVANAIDPPPRPPYTPYVPSSQGSQLTVTIKDSIRKLTHREMREMVAAIFAARDKATADKGEIDAVAKDDLADVLDRFAHGD